KDPGAEALGRCLTNFVRVASIDTSGLPRSERPACSVRVTGSVPSSEPEAGARLGGQSSDPPPAAATTKETSGCPGGLRDRAMWIMRSPLRVTLAIVLVATATSSSHAQIVSELRREAYRLSDAGPSSAAIAALDQLLERKPRDVEAHVRRGNLLL